MNEKKNQLQFSITPLGGVGEIGSNMTLIRTENDTILIDCGILFPRDDFLGINYLIPDLAFFDDKDFEPNFLFITHAHEDHLGAVIHLVQKFPDIEVWAPPLALALLRLKFEEHKIKGNIKPYSENDTFEFVDTKIFPIHVNHSVPQSYGLVITHDNSDAVLFYASDFKYDDLSPYEPPLNLKKLKTIVDKYQRKLFMIDSTNIETDGKAYSEGDLIPGIENIIVQTSNDKNLFFTLFSSNLHRLQTIFDLAEKYQKKVVISGRSILGMLKTAAQLKLIKYNQSLILEEDKLNSSQSGYIYIVSGCQGDFKSSLRRITSNEHPLITIKPGDKVIFSSRAIPGNEKQLNQIYNNIVQNGGELITAVDALIHATGHAAQDDLKFLINECRPTDIIPVHGEMNHLYKFNRFILKNFPFADCHLIQNQNEIVFNKNNVILLPHEQLKPILIHGNGLTIERSRISQRRKAACVGIVFATYITQSHSIQLSTLGLPEFINEKLQKIAKDLKHYVIKESKNNRNQSSLCEKLRIKTRQVFANILGYRPMAIIHWEE